MMQRNVLSISIAAGVVVIGLLIFLWKRPKKLKISYYEKQWKELQKLCADKTTWSAAIINADLLLNRALKKRHYTGKSMGERLVAAQRTIADNDAVWFGHKLRNKLDSDPALKLRQKEVKDALLGIRQALKDIGALPNGRSEDS